MIYGMPHLPSRQALQLLYAKSFVLRIAHSHERDKNTYHGKRRCHCHTALWRFLEPFCALAVACQTLISVVDSELKEIYTRFVLEDWCSFRKECHSLHGKPNYHSIQRALGVRSSIAIWFLKLPPSPSYGTHERLKEVFRDITTYYQVVIIDGSMDVDGDRIVPRML